MGLPNAPVTFTVAQVEELNRKLSESRHSVNNHLALIVAATELVRRKPEMTAKMIDTVAEQPQKIIEEIQKFSREFEKAFGIQRE
jgi:hypothetical protein